MRENQWREVSKEEFWEYVMTTKENVHPTPTGKYPYTSIFKNLFHDKTYFLAI